MKYLYKILRLWFCPHKWKTTANGELIQDGVCIGHYTYLQCKYCGNVKSQNKY